MEKDMARALSEVADRLLAGQGPQDLSDWIEHKPETLSREVAQHCVQLLGEHFDLRAFQDKAANHPYLMLEDAFRIDDLPDTPTAFLPVPLCNSTIRARLTALGVQHLLNKETIAYRSENNGGLFVNLVAMPGTGRLAEKSTKSMRGHTDAVSFPFAGTTDPTDARISASPDLVTLVGLRNPDSIPTHVIPLDDVLGKLDRSEIDQLARPQFNIDCQNTFGAGTEAILGERHIAIDAEVLRQVGSEYWVRFSHSKVQPDEENIAAAAARDHFAEACGSVHIPLHVEPGTLLLINNRRSLHGRSEVKKGIGGTTRWLLRTYGLATSAIRPENRYSDVSYQLFP